MLLRQTEVSQLDVAIDANEDVFRFEISVEDSFIMEIFKGKHDLRRIEHDLSFSESLVLIEVIEKRSACFKVQHHIEVFLALE